MIYYFSGTGNSKYASLKIAEALNVEAISLNEYLKKGINVIDNNNNEYLGFVFPTYDYDIPYVLIDYLKSVKIEGLNDNLYTFAIFTCGEKTGSSYVTLKNILNNKNIKLSLAYSIKMVDNSIPWFKPETKEVQEKSLKDADELLDEIIDNIKNKKEIIKTDKPLNKLFKFLVKKIMVPSQSNTKHFYVSDDCIGCGLCKSLCPMNCIEIINNKPKWNKNICSCCLSCLHRCPKSAIQYNKKTENRPRYYNPNLKE